MLRAFKAADTNGVYLFFFYQIKYWIFFSQSGFVEFKEFHHLLDLLYHYNELSKLFGQLDTNKDKRISFQEFKKGHDLIGHSHISENQLKQEFNRIDTNHGGYILFDEVCYFIYFSIDSLVYFILVLHLYGQEKITLNQSVYLMEK